MRVLLLAVIHKHRNRMFHQRTGAARADSLFLLRVLPQRGQLRRLRSGTASS